MSSDRFTQILVEAADYRSFLQNVFSFQSEKASLTYSALARKAGFASRSYPREVITGRRRITAKTLPQFIRGLSLTGDEKAYFSLLVAQTEPEVNPSGLSPAEIENRLLTLKARILKRATRVTPKAAGHFLKHEHLFEIYASLGSKEKGSPLERITQMTGLSRLICERHLAQMCLDRVVEFKSENQHYYPTDIHLSIEGLGGTEFFKQYYLKSVSEVAKRARERFQSEKDLYFASVYSMDPAKAKQFKNELRKLILQFVDETEDSHGAVLARVNVAFEVGC